MLGARSFAASASRCLPADNRAAQATVPSAADGHMKRPRSSFFVNSKAPWPSCQMTFQATATTAEDEQMPAHRIALQRLLHHQRQTGKSLCACPYGRSPTRPSHQQESGSSPTQHTIENAAKRLRVYVAIHTETPTAVQLNHHIATLPAGLRFGRRFRGGGLDCRRGLRHDHGHQRARRLEPRLFDLAKLFAPPKELADVDGGRTGNLGQNRNGLKAGCDEPLFVLARPAPTALYGRDDLNWTLGHRTTPSVW